MGEQQYMNLLQSIADVMVAVESIDTRTEEMAAVLGIPPAEEDEGACRRPQSG